MVIVCRYERETEGDRETWITEQGKDGYIEGDIKTQGVQEKPGCSHKAHSKKERVRERERERERERRERREEDLFSMTAQGTGMCGIRRA